MTGVVFYYWTLKASFLTPMRKRWELFYAQWRCFLNHITTVLIQEISAYKIIWSFKKLFSSVLHFREDNLFIGVSVMTSFLFQFSCIMLTFSGLYIKSSLLIIFHILNIQSWLNIFLKRFSFFKPWSPS